MVHDAKNSHLQQGQLSTATYLPTLSNMYKQPKPILYFFLFFFVFVKRDARILSIDIEITNIIKVKTSHGSKKSS